MSKFLNGLAVVNIELTSRCNKNCWMCGRRKIDKDYPQIAMNYGDMDFELVEKIASQLPDDIIVQFHNNGESLLYPRFGDAVSLFKTQIKCVDTNAKLIVKKANEIIDNLDSLTISVIENDLDADEQYNLVKEFLTIKGDRKPYLVYRCLGDVDVGRWKELKGIIIKRTLHNPLGSFAYKKEPTKPEIGICLDLLNHMAIDRFGKVSICIRFDPERLGVIGDVKDEPLTDIWNCEKRKKIVKLHMEGKREDVPLCGYCDYWGVPTG